MGNSSFPLSNPVAIIKSLEEGEVSDTLLALESRVSYISKSWLSCGLL
jgi:hypothetical protein